MRGRGILKTMLLVVLLILSAVGALSLAEKGCGDGLKDAADQAVDAVDKAGEKAGRVKEALE